MLVQTGGYSEMVVMPVKSSSLGTCAAAALLGCGTRLNPVIKQLLALRATTLVATDAPVDQHFIIRVNAETVSARRGCL